jgi:hypothetical protein
MFFNIAIYKPLWGPRPRTPAIDANRPCQHSTAIEILISTQISKEVKGEKCPSSTQKALAVDEQAAR